MWRSRRVASIRDVEVNEETGRSKNQTPHETKDRYWSKADNSRLPPCCPSGEETRRGSFRGCPPFAIRSKVEQPALGDDVKNSAEDDGDEGHSQRRDHERLHDSARRWRGEPRVARNEVDHEDHVGGEGEEDGQGVEPVGQKIVMVGRRRRSSGSQDLDGAGEAELEQQRHGRPEEAGRRRRRWWVGQGCLGPELSPTGEDEKLPRLKKSGSTCSQVKVGGSRKRFDVFTLGREGDFAALWERLGSRGCYLDWSQTMFQTCQLTKGDEVAVDVLEIGVACVASRVPSKLEVLLHHRLNQKRIVYIM
ncbi:hypothetical protein B296_00024486 [Ensete ventricosum]|uniref:Uncharacterized protein n=1 Tax=Ensete ventricosum TaxID=4639 RepID=A0A427AV53_ENSVE|nr:hypothetical protein B296_00024486 [Ensete ventricosum]